MRKFYHNSNGPSYSHQVGVCIKDEKEKEKKSCFCIGAPSHWNNCPQIISLFLSPCSYVRCQRKEISQMFWLEPLFTVRND